MPVYTVTKFIDTVADLGGGGVLGVPWNPPFGLAIVLMIG